MTAIRVSVTVDDIIACALVPDIGEGFKSTHPDGKDPVELAIARATGQDAMCDGGDSSDGPEIATIGPDSGANTIVVELPPEQAAWIDRYYKGEPVEPFTFDIALDDWLVALFVRSTAP